MPRVPDFADRVDGNGGGASPGSAGLFSAVPDTAALFAIVDTALINGALVGVGTLQDAWELDKASADALSFPDVLPTLSGVGRWKRKYIGGVSWTAQATWYVDPGAGGNDEYDGTAAVHGAGYVGPIKTVAELCKRLRNGCPTVDMSVNLLANDTTTDLVLDINFGTGAFRTLRITGIRTFLNPAQATSAITTYSAASSTADLFTSAALPVSWTASGFVEKLGVFTTGVATDGVFAVESDLGAKQARVSRPIVPLTITQVQPVANDQFRMFTCTLLGGNVYVETRGNGQVEFVDLDLASGLSANDGVVVRAGAAAYFYSCYVQNCTNYGFADFVGSLHNGIFHTLSPQASNLDAGLFIRTGGHAVIIDQGGTVVVFNAAMVGRSSGVEVSAGGYLYCLDSLMVYDSTGDALDVDGRVECGASVAIFGTTNVGVGVDVTPDGFVGYSSRKPTLTGTAGDAQVGGLLIDWTMVPFTNPDEQSAIRDLASGFIGANYAMSMSLMFNAGLMPH